MATEAAHQWQGQQTTVDNCRSGIPVATLAKCSNKPEQQLDNNKLCYGIIKHYPPTMTPFFAMQQWCKCIWCLLLLLQQQQAQRQQQQPLNNGNNITQHYIHPYVHIHTCTRLFVGTSFVEGFNDCLEGQTDRPTNTKHSAQQQNLHQKQQLLLLVLWQSRNSNSTPHHTVVPINTYFIWNYWKNIE